MQGFIITLLICSVTMSVLVLFYMAVTPLLARRYSVMSRYYTWLVFVIGLIVPFRPQFSNAIVKVDMPSNTAAPIIRMGNDMPVTTPAANALPSALTNILWWQIAGTVWLLGMVIFLVYHVFKHYRFLRLTTRWSKNITDEQMLTIFQNLKTQMGLSTKIGLQFCDCIGSPMMIGFTNPRILLPNVEFAKDELCFILKHELVHYKRKDLWYKCLVLIATAIHWFNPIVHLMAKAIDIQCELSCDAEVVRSTDADTRQYYSETIIGVVRYKSKLKTALSTNFYGGKKGMKHRIFSIMDMSKKKVGAVVLCSALILTFGTGFAFATKAAAKDSSVTVTPWIAVDGFVPTPDVYAPYAAFGITISADGTKLLYQGQPVRQFVDEKADSWAFYLDGAGTGNWTAVRNATGELTGIEGMTEQKAQEYYERFFEEELDPNFLAKVQEEAERDLAEDMAREGIQEDENKYISYQAFGITCSVADEVLYFNGQRVRFLIDWPAGDPPYALWTDDAGTVNVAVLRDASGQITGIENISVEKAQEYQSAVDKYNQDALVGLDERIEARMNALYPEN